MRKRSSWSKTNLALVAGLAMLNGCCDLDITSGALPDGVVGLAYEYEFDADCDNDEWSLISGDLPPGLSLKQDGELAGTPTVAGMYVLTVGVGAENGGDFVSKGFSLTITDPVP